MRGALVILARHLKLDLKVPEQAKRATEMLAQLEASGLLESERARQFDEDARAYDLMGEVGATLAAQRLGLARGTLYRAAERHRARLKGAAWK